MKKTIIIALVLALCLPVVSHAVEESAFVGTWIQENYNEETGRYSFELLRLTADHQAYYCIQSFEPGEKGLGREAAKTWSVKGNGIHIILGENSETDAVILDDGRLGFKLISGAYSPFYKIVDPALKDGDSGAGIYVPGGYWEVGADIPAGVYSISNPGNIRSQNFVIYEGYNEATGRYSRTIVNTILNNSNAIIGKIELRDGNVVHVYEGVYFSVPVKLDFPWR